MRKALYGLLYLIAGKEGKTVMAMLFATKVILGKITYTDVPVKLRTQVAEILTENGLEDMITE